MPKPLTHKERSIASKFRKLEKAQQVASANYERVDTLTREIAELAGGDGQRVRISADGKFLEVTDNYLAAVRNPKLKPGQMPKAWAHGCVRQFDVKEVSMAVE